MTTAQEVDERLVLTPILFGDDEAIARAIEYNQTEVDAGRVSKDSMPPSLALFLEEKSLVTGAISELLSPHGVEAVAQWQRSYGLTADGWMGPATRSKARLARMGVHFDRFKDAEYEPDSVDANELFLAVFEFLDLRASADDMLGLHRVMDRESDGWVGRPNYTYQEVHGDRIHKPSRRDDWPIIWGELRSGNRTARSSAIGLGQLLLGNCNRYMPSRAFGISCPFNEAVGFVRYVLGRYWNPEVEARQAFVDVWEFYEMDEFEGEKKDRPNGCVYGWRSLAKYGGPGLKPGEGY
jgi:hypothetical protein|tara:strand:- start:10807 stop:11691 length:885 start_codon:yes stop_codon:yes gene_type:complete